MIKQVTLYRLPPQVPAALFEGDVADLEAWVVGLSPDATVTATTTPVGALIEHATSPDVQVEPGQYVLFGQNQVQTIEDEDGYRPYWWFEVRTPVDGRIAEGPWINEGGDTLRFVDEFRRYPDEWLGGF